MQMLKGPMATGPLQRSQMVARLVEPHHIAHAHVVQDLSVEGGAEGAHAPRVVVVVAIIECGEGAP